MDRAELDAALQRRRERYLANRAQVIAAQRARHAAMTEEERAARLAQMHAYRQRNGSALKTKRQEYERLNRERIAARQRAYYLLTREEQLAQKKDYASRNIEKIKAKTKRYQITAAAKLAAANVARRSAVKAATPPWADFAEMQQFYELARDLSELTGECHQVDHVVPIRHRLVCGLHCTANLQVLTEVENKSKGNKFMTDWSSDGTSGT